MEQGRTPRPLHCRTTHQGSRRWPWAAQLRGSAPRHPRPGAGSPRAFLGLPRPLSPARSLPLWSPAHLLGFPWNSHPLRWPHCRPVEPTSGPSPPPPHLWHFGLIHRDPELLPVLLGAPWQPVGATHPPRRPRPSTPCSQGRSHSPGPAHLRDPSRPLAEITCRAPVAASRISRQAWLSVMTRSGGGRLGPRRPAGPGPHGPLCRLRPASGLTLTPAQIGPQLPWTGGPGGERLSLSSQQGAAPDNHSQLFLFFSQKLNWV